MSSSTNLDTFTMDWGSIRRLEALEVQEILDLIMSFLHDNEDLLAASLVCKTWNSIALDHLWRTLHSVIPLFKLLGPRVFLNDRWNYADTISQAGWERFEFYGRKVRKIDNECNQSTMEEVEAESLIQFFNSAAPSNPYIFPRIAEINWAETSEAGWLLYLPPFLSPTLKSFTLKLKSGRNTSSAEARTVLRQLSLLPGLKLEHLGVRWNNPTWKLDTVICAILDLQSKSLKSFSHLSFNLDERLGASISQLQSLIRLELQFLEVSKRTNADFYSFSDALASRCPGLQTVRFRIPLGPGGFRFCAFQPLTRIKELKGIRVECADLVLKVQDFQEMGTSWRSLEALGFPDSSIPLPWLAAVAKHFSSTLEHMDVSIWVTEDLDPDSTGLTPFTSLKRVSFLGYVPPESFTMVGSLFQQLVAPETVVECAKGIKRHLAGLTGNSVKWMGRGTTRSVCPCRGRRCIN